jgi:hypothetical protein
MAERATESVAAAGRAGVAYAAFVFAAGCVLGAIRLYWVVPRLGSAGAVLLELPIILTVSWLAGRWAVMRWRVQPAPALRVLMGGTAFAVLVTLEFTLAAVAFDGSIAGFRAGYRSFAGVIGLTGQVAFAVIPLAQIYLSPSNRTA